MHLIAYINENTDPHEARAALLLQHPTFKRIAMRAGWMWKAESNAEAGFTTIHAPGYPGIVSSYLLHFPDIKVSQESLPRVAPPNEIVELPQFAEVSILSAGPNLRREIAEIAPRGPCIAVNAAGKVGCDWHVANDGFAFPHMVTDCNPIRVCRLRHAPSLPGGRWFDLERLGIHEGILSPICALRLAKAMGAKVVWLYGHDLIPGPGVDGLTSETETALRDIGATVETAIREATASGMTINRITVKDGAVIVNGVPIPGEPVVRTSTRRGRQSKT